MSANATASVASLTIMPDTLQVDVKVHGRLTADARDAAGNPVPDAAISWVSTHSDLQIDSNGDVYGTEGGLYRVIASAGSATDTAMVLVLHPVPTLRTLSPTQVPAGSAAFDVIIYATPIFTGAKLSWNGNLLSLSYYSGGRYRARVPASYVAQDGVAEIRVINPAPTAGPSAPMMITIGDGGTAPAPARVASVSVSPTSGSRQVGQTMQFTASAQDSAGNPLTGRSVTWSSSNNQVATVSPSGVVTAIAPGGATITATVDGVAGAAAFTATTAAPAAVASVNVAPAADTAVVGATAQFTATTRDAQGNILTGRSIAWSSSDTTVATVSSSGVATARRTGVATITATSEGSSGTGRLVVVASSPAPVATVAVSPANDTTIVGSTVQYSAVARDAQGNVLTGRAVAWSSTDTTIAVISATGLLTARAAGVASIRATSEGITGTTQITVQRPAVASVAISPANATAIIGGTAQFTATARDAQGNILTGRVVTWTSSDTTIATINATGLATARRAGNTVIRGTVEGQSGAAQFVVTAPSVASVAVTPATASLQVGATQQFTAVARDAQGNILTGRVVSWRSSDTTVAAISATGLATARAAGSATITATSEGVSGTAQLSVSGTLPPPPSGSCEAVSPARCWFIGLSGSDTNAGTSSSAPFATFTRALTAANAGDFIYYLAGTYTDGARHFINYDKNLNGAGGQRITIKPYAGATVVFDNQGRNSSLAYLAGQGAVVEGFEFRNSRYGGPSGAINGWTQGVAIWGRYIHFRSNYVHDITGDANGNGGSLRIQNTSDNQVYNNYFDRLSVGNSGAASNVNHVIVMDGANNRIFNNYFSNSASGCFLQKHPALAGNRAFVYNNTFVNCGRHGVNIEGAGYTVHHNLFINSTMSFDYSGASGNVFEYNTIYHSASSVIGGRGQPNTMRRNIVYQTASSFVMGDGLVTVRLSHYGGDAEYQAGVSGDAFDFNCYFNPSLAVRFSYYGGSPTSTGGIYTLAQIKSLGKEVNSVEANPMFVNIAANDFRTQAGSACSGMGVYAAGSVGSPPLTAAAALGR